MATDVERLVVLLEANSENLRRQMRGAERVVDRSSRQMENRLTSLRNAFIAVGGALLIRQTVALADAYRNLENRLRLVTETEDERVELMGRLSSLSAETRVGLRGTVDLYSRLARSLEGVVDDEEELLQLTRTINQAVALSGTTAASAEAALFQLGQGMAAGALRGQELNSVMEQTPRLAEAIADGLGVTIGQLREMGRQGQITSEALVEALGTEGRGQAGAVAAEFADTLRTVEQAWQGVNDQALIFAGTLNEATGATNAFSFLLQGVADKLASMTDQLRILQAYRDQPQMTSPTGGGGGWGGPAVGGFSTLLRPSSITGPSVGPQMVDEEERLLEVLRRQEEANEALKDLANERLVIAGKLADAAENLKNKELEALRQMQQSLQRTVDGFLSAIENAESLEDALKRIVIQMLRMALTSETGGNFLQTAFSAVANAVFGGSAIPGKAVGGYVAGGKSYMVGERGPELFTPRTGGNITPNGARAGSGGPININIDARGAQRGVAEEIQAAVPGLLRLVDARIRDNASRGGAFAGSLGRA